jgi:hypothetical protein
VAGSYRGGYGGGGGWRCGERVVGGAGGGVCEVDV